MEGAEEKIVEDERQKQSPLGITSFTLSIISAAIFSLIVIIINSAIRIGLDSEIFFTIIFVIYLVGFAISLTGIVIGISGIFTKRKKRALAIAGAIINLWVLFMFLLILNTFLAVDFPNRLRWIF